MVLGKILIVLGIFMVIAGLAITYSDKFFLLGHLPGDIHWSWGQTKFYFPIISSLAVSVIGSIIINLFFRK